MQVFIIRHGIAELRENWDKPDFERPLTDKGRKKTEAVAEGLRRLEVALTHLYTSPLTRAQQTAEIIQKKLKIHKLQQTDLMRDDADPTALLTFLNEHDRDAALALVGHEPHVSELLGFLVTGEKISFTTFKKAGIAMLEGELPAQAGGFQLRWLAEPKHFTKK